MHSTESSKLFTETILILSKNFHWCRVRCDIARRGDGFKNQDVSIAMKNLREKSDLMQAHQDLYISRAGRAITEMIYRQHELLSKDCFHAGVDSVTTEDACHYWA